MRNRLIKEFKTKLQFGFNHISNQNLAKADGLDGFNDPDLKIGAKK